MSPPPSVTGAAWPHEATRAADAPKSSSAQVDARIGWLDAAKGVGIVLVVVGHALGGLIDSPLGKGLDGFRSAFFAIYTFHMPLFFMLSGVLVADRLARNAAGFARSLLTGIAWPYFLWSAVQFTIIYAMGSLVNQPVERYWPTILSLPWHTVSQFWFLYALFILHLFALIALRPLGLAGFLIVGLALKPLTLIADLPEVLRFAASQAPYYAIGLFLGAEGIAALVVRRPPWIRAVALPVGATVLILLTWMAVPAVSSGIGFDQAPAARIAFLAWQYQAMPAALAGSFAVIALASLAGGKALAALSFLGRRSMSIFIFHILAIAGTRIILIRFGHVGDPALILPLSVLIGIAGPLAADAVLRRLRLTKPLGLA